MNEAALRIKEALNHCLIETNLSMGKKMRGKVRDTYDLGNELLLITTDRLSAFDRVLAAVPFKGQVLNLSSAWWFEKTSHIVANHMISLPDPNAMLAKKCKVFPVEFVVRGYITGSTKTSIWTQYQKGFRTYCGHQLADGLKKNQKLPHPIITPTTKADSGDELISADNIIQQRLMTKAQWDEASSIVLQLFEFGSKLALQKGLILVDSKYELGIDENGSIILIDELHTPDSSRYWYEKTYQEHFESNQEPENIDKEFIRLWFMKHCNPYQDKVLPKAPDELIETLAARYIHYYELITSNQFPFSQESVSIEERITKNLQDMLARL